MGIQFTLQEFKIIELELENLSLKLRSTMEAS